MSLCFRDEPFSKIADTHRFAYHYLPDDEPYPLTKRPDSLWSRLFFFLTKTDWKHSGYSNRPSAGTAA